jgi:hypothetical protein
MLATFTPRGSSLVAMSPRIKKASDARDTLFSSLPCITLMQRPTRDFPKDPNVELEPLKRRPATMALTNTDGSDTPLAFVRRLMKQYGVQPAMLKDDNWGLSDLLGLGIWCANTLT